MIRFWLSTGVLLFACMCSLPVVAEVREATRSGKGDVAKGKVLFGRHCAGCHGSEGQGNGYKLLGPDPANLTAPSTKKKSDVELLKTIHEGKPNMPSWKMLLSKEDSRDVLAYVRTLAP